MGCHRGIGRVDERVVDGRVPVTSQVAPDGSRGRGGRIPRSRERPQSLDDAIPLEHRCDAGSRHHEIDQGIEKVPATVQCVLTLEPGARRILEFESDDVVALGFYPPEDLADEAPPNRVRLDEHQGAFHHEAYATPPLPSWQDGFVITLDDFDTYPDFPVPGVLFYDIGPILRDPDLFKAACDDLVPSPALDIDLVAGVDARGFIFAPMVAQHLHVGLTMVRKVGKLPGALLTATASIEYGAASLTLNPKGIAGKHVLVVDDVLATGGTAKAVASMLEEAGAARVSFTFLLEITALPGREVLSTYEVASVVQV